MYRSAMLWIANNGGNVSPALGELSFTRRTAQLKGDVFSANGGYFLDQAKFRQLRSGYVSVPLELRAASGRLPPWSDWFRSPKRRESATAEPGYAARQVMWSLATLLVMSAIIFGAVNSGNRLRRSPRRPSEEERQQRRLRLTSRRMGSELITRPILVLAQAFRGRAMGCFSLSRMHRSAALSDPRLVAVSDPRACCACAVHSDRDPSRAGDGEALE